MAHTENSTKKSGVPYPVKIVIGIALIALSFFMKTQALKIGIIDLDPGVTFATIGMLLLLFPLVEMFYTRPLGDAIEERNRELEHTFSEAENLRTEMQTMRTDYERRLQEADAQAREQIQATIREAQQLRQSLMAEASEKADALMLEAQERIALERDRIIREIRLQVVDLTLAAAEKVIGENMNDDRNRRLINDFIDTVEVVR